MFPLALLCIEGAHKTMTATTFKEIFLPKSGQMYRTAYAILGNAQDAEDAVQEAFIRLWQTRDKIVTDERLEAYCTMLTRHLCIDNLRRKRVPTTDRQAEELSLDADYDASNAVERNETIAAVEEAIGSLPDHQQRVARMSIIDDRSPQEIEQETGFSAVNVRVLLSRAKSKLKTLLRP